ncbi:MAG: DUF5681 domain-containing protein [Pseudomonadota bacterium]
MAFKKGQSGNPEGRPKGITDKRAQLRSLLDPHADDLINKAVEMALNGDSAAMRLCVERLVPAYRNSSPTVNLPAMEGTPTEKAEAVLKAMAEAQLSVEDANAVLAAITQSTKIAEFDELDKRISALEARSK